MTENFPDGTTIIRTGLPDQDLNIVFIFKPPKFTTDIVRSVREFFLDSNTNYEVVITKEAKEASIPIIRKLNLGVLRKEPGMFLDHLPDSSDGLPDHFEILRVKDMDELSAFFRTMNAGFGSPPDSFDPFIEQTRRRWTNARVLDTGDTVSFYLGYFHGRPVSTSLRFTTAHIAGIYAVSTLEAFRRRGFGKAMVSRALIEGKLEESCTTSFLQASEMGRPIYERMGYRILSEYEVWTEKIASLAGRQRFHIQV